MAPGPRPTGAVSSTASRTPESSQARSVAGASAAGGIALINSVGNLSGFAAPFITGWLTDLTGTAKAGLWLVGIITLLASVVVFILGHAPKDADPVVES